MIECGGGEDRKEALTRRARQTECKKEGKKEKCSEAHEDRATKTAEAAPAARSRGRSQRGGKQGRRRQIDTDSLSIET